MKEVISVADLPALRIAALTHARKLPTGEALPEPIGLSINRQKHLTLVFDDHRKMSRWRDQLLDPRPLPSEDPYAEQYVGELVLREQTPVGPISYTVRTTVVSRT